MENCNICGSELEIISLYSDWVEGGEHIQDTSQIIRCNNCEREQELTYEEPQYEPEVDNEG